jgi:hypothetical protein
MPPTISLPKIGITVNKFKITKAAQKDIFPETTTYPVNAVASDSRKMTDPLSQTRTFEGVTTLEKPTLLPRWINAKITAKLAPSMCNRRSSQMKFPCKTDEMSCSNWNSSVHERIPRRKKPVRTCEIQKIRVKKARLWPKWSFETWKLVRSCRKKSKKRGRNSSMLGISRVWSSVTVFRPYFYKKPQRVQEIGLFRGFF